MDILDQLDALPDMEGDVGPLWLATIAEIKQLRAKVACLQGQMAADAIANTMTVERLRAE